MVSAPAPRALRPPTVRRNLVDSSKSKAKIARRLIEVLEFFANAKRVATVTDIVRHYQRPQSSTSELMRCLVEAGLLYQDSKSRTYSPTPQLAAMGNACQPEPIASGRLFSAMDALAARSELALGLVGIVGTSVQVFRWGNGRSDIPAVLGVGHNAPLFSCPAGLLLLAQIDIVAAGQILWRNLAEQDAHARFSLSELKRQVECFGISGHAAGDFLPLPNHKVAAVPLPLAHGVRPLALSAVYDDHCELGCDEVIALLQDVVAHSCEYDGRINTIAGRVIEFCQDEGPSGMVGAM